MYHCKLLSGSFALLIQLTLVILSITVLLTKRYLEKPKRTPLIFILDVSKQAFSSIFAHFGNIIIAMIMANVQLFGTQCGWYFISYLVDSVIGGLVISIGLLKLLGYLANKYDWFYLKESGNYGNPINYKIYFVQMITWTIITIFGRVCSGFIIYLFLIPLDVIVNFIDSLFNKYQLELGFVMVICPIAINLLSLVVIDGYLKRQSRPTREEQDEQLQEQLQEQLLEILETEDMNIEMRDIP